MNNNSELHIYIAKDQEYDMIKIIEKDFLGNKIYSILIVFLKINLNKFIYKRNAFSNCSNYSQIRLKVYLPKTILIFYFISILL